VEVRGQRFAGLELGGSSKQAGMLSEGEQGGR
jgi:hypothetical protein